MTGKFELLMDLWAIRCCFICKQRGPCDHREIEVDHALIEASYRIRKPLTRELSHSTKSVKSA